MVLKCRDHCTSHAMGTIVKHHSRYKTHIIPCYLHFKTWPILTEKCGLKLKVVLKWRDVYFEYISLTCGLIKQGILKWRGLKSQGSLYMYMGESLQSKFCLQRMAFGRNPKSNVDFKHRQYNGCQSDLMWTCVNFTEGISGKWKPA